MANTYATPKVYANVGLALLTNELVVAKCCDSESVEKEFKPGIGTTVYVKRPPEFIIRDGASNSGLMQDVIEGEIAVNCDKQKGVDVQFTGYEMTANVDQLLKSKVIAGSMAQIASQIDGDLIDQTKFFHNSVGTIGNTISTVAGFFAGPQRLDEMAVPTKDRYALMTPNDGYALAGTFTGVAALAGDTAQSALKKAEIPMLGNTKPYITQTIPQITTGNRVTTTTLVNGASQNVTYLSARTTYTQSLICDGQVSKTYKAGEKFTIANVFAVNPRNKAVMTYLKQFTIQADATSDGSGNVTLSISPPIITSGAFQTVSAAPADNAALTHSGALSTTYSFNSAFQRQAIKLVGLQPPKPFTGESDYATDPATGITVRYWRYSDGSADTHVHRWDVYYGVKNVDPRLGTQLFGA
jgi:hypothetical protein